MSPFVIFFIFLFACAIAFYKSLTDDFDKIDNVLPENSHVIGVFEEDRTTEVDGYRVTTGKNHYLEVETEGGRQYLLPVDEHVYMSYKMGFEYVRMWERFKDQFRLK